MRILHCGDFHLDSRMTSFLTPDKAAERRRELLLTFQRMVEAAKLHSAEAVIIAGDLFDRKTCSAAARNTVAALIRENLSIAFFYLQGNHDTGGVFKGMEEQLPNLHLFSPDRWTGYSLAQGRVCITGAEWTASSEVRFINELQLDKDTYNIVVLHGQIIDGKAGGRGSRSVSAAEIPLRSLAGREIDYLALGHVHKRSSGKLDGRGIWCYSGCPEGRGFDECGEQGCVLIELDPDTHETALSFLPLGGRVHHEILLNAEPAAHSGELLPEIRKKLKEQGAEEKDLIRVLLTGNRGPAMEIPAVYLEQQLSPFFYYVKVEDRTRAVIRESDFASDPSLKGEFVRLVQKAEDLTEEEKSEVLQMGIRLLSQS